MTENPDALRRSRVDEAEVSLRRLIAERRSVGGDRLPPEKDLSTELGVSRDTLRAALTRLESEGEVDRRRRIGTLITSPEKRKMSRSSLAFPTHMMLSLSEYLRAVGVDYSVRAVGIRRDPATEDVGTSLGLPPSSPVFISSRLYEVEDEPAAFLEHILPTVLYGHDVRIELLTEGVTTFLRETEHVHLTNVESTVTAEAASADLASELQVDVGVPLLVMHTKLYSDGPSPVALGRLVFRPDVLRFAASAREDDAGNAETGFDVVPLVNPHRDSRVTTTSTQEEQ